MRQVLAGSGSRAVKVLGAVVMMTALAMALPTLVSAASDVDKAAPAAPVLKVDPARHPTIVLDGDEANVEHWESILAKQRATSLGAHLATLSPWVYLESAESWGDGWTATSPWNITTEWRPPWAPPMNNSWSDSPGANYADYANVSLVSPVINLSAAGAGQMVALSFSYRCELEEEYDVVMIGFSGDGGTTWDDYDYVTGFVDDGWMWTQIPSSVCTSQFRFRFRLVSDESVNYDGIHIDNMWIDAYSTDWVEEDDAKLSYLGNWSTGSGTTYWDDGGSWTWYHRFTSTPGNLVRLDFTGPAVSLWGKTSPSYGIMSVSLDGGTPELVDCYVDPSDNPDYWQYPEVLKSYQYLADGPHTLTICCTGIKNPASAGYAVSVDSAEVWGKATQAPPPAHKEQVGPPADLYYQGPWTQVVADTAASGASLATVDAMGSSVNVKFDGTYLAWNSKKGPGFGKAKVSVDGGPLQPVDLYYPWNSSKQRVFNTGLLEDGTHTLSIYCSGEKNAAASSTKINVDSFDVYDGLLPADPAPHLQWRYQETDANISYLGAWSNSGNTGWLASGNSFKSTSQTGAAVVIKFTGTAVTPMLRTAPWYGKAKLTLDPGTPGEQPPQTIDLYSAAVGWKVMTLYSKTGLPNTPHTLVIECTGQKHGSSSGYAIGLDAFDITGYADQAQAITKIDDKDASCVYPTVPPLWGRWDDSKYWAAYLDTYALTDRVGSKMTFTFDGTLASWVACTSNTKGKAQLKLYSGSVAPANLLSTTEVDLYSPTTLWKVPVYSTGLLTSGTYVIEIECLGTKNVKSWYHTIDVDRFDILPSGA